jgi:hypothetical protein
MVFLRPRRPRSGAVGRRESRYMRSAVLSARTMARSISCYRKAGVVLAHNPTRTLRFFTFGTEPAFGHKFGVAWCRTVGWFFAVGGSLGVLLYLILLSMDFWRSR